MSKNITMTILFILAVVNILAMYFMGDGPCWLDGLPDYVEPTAQAVVLVAWLFVLSSIRKFLYFGRKEK